MSRFLFSVTNRSDKWCVYLPHQCNEWAITGYDNYDRLFVSHEQAILDLSEFIREASEALNKLVDKEEL